MAIKQNEKQQGDLEQVVTPLKKANNILVTIGTDPTVDQFAACIGLTLVLNKMGKHATAVFSGVVPSTIEFLKPEKTLEKNTDSLRDFIIALDKSKADKLRYKVEDNVVKIFITPYKTSISEKDLEFSQGDFNVDVVMALGVHDKKHLDQAITAHGRILHDATVITVNNQSGGHIGSVDWTDPNSSSLCEMMTDVVQNLSSDVFDNQNATAFLTGIVAETERYSNDKASPHTMAVAGVLMSAGASTQLVSSELDSAAKSQILPPPLSETETTNDSSPQSTGELEIDHTVDTSTNKKEEKSEPTNQAEIEEENDEFLENLNLSNDHKASDEPDTNRLIKDPPQFTGQLTANSVPEDQQYSGSIDPLSGATNSDSPLLGKSQENSDTSSVKENVLPTKPDLEDKTDQTLKEIEESLANSGVSAQSVDPPTSGVSEPTSIGEVAQLSVDEARKATDEAAVDENRPKARQDIGTTPLGGDYLKEDSQNNDRQQFNSNESESSSSDPTSPPPPVPPPITPPTSP